MSNGTSSWNRPHESVKSEAGRAKKAPSAIRGIVAGLVVVAIAAVCVFIFMGKDEKPTEKTEKKSARIKEVKPAPSRKVENPPATPLDNVQEPVKEPVKKKVTAEPSYSTIVRLMDGTVVTNRPKSIFKRDFEKGLMVALRPNGISGSLLAMIRSRYTDDQLLTMLKELTLPKDDDPPGVRKCKDQVQALKEEMLIEISKGRSVGEVFAELQNAKAMDHMVSVKTERMLHEAVLSGDGETVRDAAEKVNALRVTRGLEPLAVPERFRIDEAVQRDETVQSQQGESVE